MLVNRKSSLLQKEWTLGIRKWRNLLVILLNVYSLKEITLLLSRGRTKYKIKVQYELPVPMKNAIFQQLTKNQCGNKNKGSWDYNKCDSCKWRFKSKKMLAEHSCQGPPKQFSATSIHNEAPKRYARENRPPPDTGPLFLYGDEIKQTNSFKYLGSTITEDAKDDVELKLRLNLASKIFYRLHRSLKGLLTLDKKLKLLNVVIMAILLYGSEAWILTEKQKNKLQAFHNKALRLITGKFPTIQRRADGIIIDITFPHYSSLLTTTESQDVIETWKDRVENFRARSE